MWYDADAFDNESNYDSRYILRVTEFPDNEITREVEILERNISAVAFCGTVLNITSPKNESEIAKGPYPILYGLNTTYYDFQNGTRVYSGNKTLLIAAVELASGARIVASGSTMMFCNAPEQYNYIVYDSTLAFDLLITAWLLNISPDTLLVPFIKEIEPSESLDLYPGYTKNVSLLIYNPSTEPKGPLSLMVETPYFTTIENKTIYVRNSSGIFTAPFEYGALVPLGMINGSESMRIMIPVSGWYGLEKSGVFRVTLYCEGQEIMAKELTINMHSAFTLEAQLERVFLNLSETNSVILMLRMNLSRLLAKRDARISVDIYINVSPSDAAVCDQALISDVLLDKIVPSDKINVTITLSREALLEITIYAKAEWHSFSNITLGFPGEIVIRKILVATTEKVILFDEGHNQYYRFASQGMQDFLEILRNYKPVIVNEGSFSPELLSPEISSLVIIPNPEPVDDVIFSDEELDALQRFIEGGGTVIIMGNWYRYFWPDAEGGYNDLTGKYGIYWFDGDVYDPKNNFGPSYSVKVMNFADNEIARIFTTGVEYVRYAGTALNITNATANVPVEIYPILLGNNETFLTLGAETEPRIKNGSDVIMMVVAIVNGSGRIIATGSSYMFSDYYYFSENKMFIENLIMWIYGSKKLDMIVSPEPSKYVGEKLEVNVTILNRGTVSIHDLELQVIYTSPVKCVEVPDLHKNELKPGEEWFMTLKFTSSEPGNYFVELILQSPEYPERIDILVPLVFKERGLATGTLLIVIAGVSAVVIATVVLLIRMIRRKKEYA